MPPGVLPLSGLAGYLPPLYLPPLWLPPLWLPPHLAMRRPG